MKSLCSSRRACLAFLRTALAVLFALGSALPAFGQGYGWGSGVYSSLGNNTTSNAGVPTAVYTAGALSGKTMTQISASPGDGGP